MKNLISILFIVLLSGSLWSQYSGPRLFWDIPNLYLTAPDVGRISEHAGIGLGTAFNVAAHWGTARVGGGAAFTFNPSAEKIPESFLATPYLLLEAGAGRYRTNGNQCNRTQQNAFTAMALLGLRYDFDLRSLTEADPPGVQGLHWGAGAEFGYFFIRDVFSNTEVVLRGTYFPAEKVASASLGLKFFLNVREWGGRY